MNSIKYHSHDEIKQMLEQFDKISNKDNTTVKRYSMSIQYRCDCGCEKVEHYNVPTKHLNERFYVELCPEHEITFDHDKETTTPKGT